MLNDEKKLNEYCEQSNDKLLMGSISHRFVDTVEHLNSQYNYYNLEMANDEIILLQVIYRTKIYFFIGIYFYSYLFI